MKNTTNRITNARLAEIGSIEELLEVQGKMKRASRRIERNMHGRYREAKDMYSVKDTVYMAIDIIDEVQSLARYFFRGVFGGRKSRRSNRRY